MTTRTAAERRQRAKVEYDAFVAACPTRELLATISDKWVTLVLTALADGPKRHGELRVRIAGVSQKMLTQTLRSLERGGLVDRAVTPEVPVRVDYSLTPLGRSLLPVVAAVKTWAEENMDIVRAAQRRYDSRTPGLSATTPRV
ncbi:winged helix-turn-helix transcriptional regulator [Nocardia sp. NPDC004068]|uniref:winged helix-turn-helix transcriptional regulator n=1 Tax=Nocardia sp. NPDC004068 TaxID=3364303 RepID=UPI0036B8CEDA